jgi:WD40 repeat protein
VASLVATVIAVVNGNAAADQARIALARQLAAQAITLSETDLQLASLLAVEAHRLNDDVQTRAALFRLASASPYLAKTLDVGATVTATAVSSDGVVLTGDDDGHVFQWPEGHAQELLQMPGRVQNVSMSADGTVVAAVSDDLAVVTAAGRAEELRLGDAGWEGESLSQVSVSPDGRFVVAGDQNGSLALFEDLGGGYQAVGNVPFGGEVGWGEDSFTVMDGTGEWARVRVPDLTVLDSGTHIIPMSASGAAVSGDGATMAGQVELGVNYLIWDADSTGGDAPDRLATSQVSGALDTALDDHGTRFAALVEGAIYVSTTRDPATLPEPPLVLDGAGDVTASTLSFTGDHLVSGTGPYALVWDLRQNGRITSEVEADVAEPCSACGPPLVRPNHDGSRVITTDVTGTTALVSDLSTGRTVQLVDGEGGSYSAAAWFDDDRIIAFTGSVPGLRILSGDDFSTVDATVPFSLASDAVVALAIRSDGDSGGRTTVLDDTGMVQTVDLGTGQVVASSDALSELWSGPAPGGFDIAPDQTTAFVYFLGGAAGYVDIATDRMIYRAENLDGAGFDAESAYHVFAKGSEWLVDAGDGSLGPAHPATVEYSPPPVLSPDGQVVATGGATGTVTLLTLDGRGSVFGRIDVPVEAHRFAMYAFTPDGTAMITAIQSMANLGRPATIRRLDLRTESWADSACALAGRDLTAAEWSAYVGTTPPADLRCSR